MLAFHFSPELCCQAKWFIDRADKQKAPQSSGSYVYSTFTAQRELSIFPYMARIDFAGASCEPGSRRLSVPPFGIWELHWILVAQAIPGTWRLQGSSMLEPVLF